MEAFFSSLKSEIFRGQDLQPLGAAHTTPRGEGPQGVGLQA